MVPSNTMTAKYIHTEFPKNALQFHCKTKGLALSLAYSPTLISLEFVSSYWMLNREIVFMPKPSTLDLVIWIRLTFLKKKLKLFTHSMSISMNHNNIKAQKLHLQEVWCTWKLNHGGLWDSSSIKFPINTIWWSVNEYF